MYIICDLFWIFTIPCRILLDSGNLWNNEITNRLVKCVYRSSRNCLWYLATVVDPSLTFHPVCVLFRGINWVWHLIRAEEWRIVCDSLSVGLQTSVVYSAVSWSTRAETLWRRRDPCGGWNWRGRNGPADSSTGSIRCEFATSPPAATWASPRITSCVCSPGELHHIIPPWSFRPSMEIHPDFTPISLPSCLHSNSIRENDYSWYFHEIILRVICKLPVPRNGLLQFFIEFNSLHVNKGITLKAARWI